MNHLLQPRQSRRKGTLYITVLISTVLVSVLSWAGLMLLGVRGVKRQSNSDLWQARVLADSAIDLAIARTRINTDWQSSHEHGTASSRVALMDGQAWYVLSNEATDLEASLADDYLITGFGTVDGATVARQVIANSIGVPPSTLDHAVVVGEDCDMGLYDNSLTTDGGARIGGAVIGTGGPVVAYPLTIDGASGEVDSLQFAGDWRDYYFDHGTKIELDALQPVWYYGTIVGYALGRTVLSATNNTFGEPNENGIYYIDGGGLTIYIYDCRIEATVMLTNAANNSNVQGNVHWTSPASDLPALAVDGSCEFLLSGNDLRESSKGVNFNPDTTPFQGESDSDQSDRYPSRIQGVTFVSEDLKISDPENGTASRLVGTLVVAGKLTVHGPVNVHTHPNYYHELPRGFYASYYLQPQAGGYRSVASDWTP